MGLLDFLRGPVRTLDAWTSELPLERIDLEALVTDMGRTGVPALDQLLALHNTMGASRVSRADLTAQTAAIALEVPVDRRGALFARMLMSMAASQHLAYGFGRACKPLVAPAWYSIFPGMAYALAQSDIRLDDPSTAMAARAIMYRIPAAQRGGQARDLAGEVQLFARCLSKPLSRAQSESIAATADAIDQADWTLLDFRTILWVLEALFPWIDRPISQSSLSSREAKGREIATASVDYICNGVPAPLEAYIRAIVATGRRQLPFVDRPGVADMQTLDPASTGTLLAMIVMARTRAKGLVDNRVQNWPRREDWYQFAPVGILIESHDCGLDFLFKSILRRKVVASDAAAATLITHFLTLHHLQDLRVVKIAETTMAKGPAPETRQAVRKLLAAMNAPHHGDRSLYQAGNNNPSWSGAQRASLRDQTIRRLSAALDGQPTPVATAGPAAFAADEPLPPHPRIGPKEKIYERVRDYYGDLADLRKCTPDDIHFLETSGLAPRYKVLDPFILPNRLRKAAALPEEFRLVWKALHVHARELEGKSKPTDKWMKAAKSLVHDLSPDQRIAFLSAVLDIIIPDARAQFAADNLARAVIYVAKDWPAGVVGPILIRHAQKIYFQTVPGHGILSERLGNACLWSLINMPEGGGVPYLARLLARVKYPKVKKKINAALNEAAAAAGLTRASLDELTVPTHDLARDGTLSIPAGACHADIAVTGPRDVSLSWRDAAGKPIKSIPSAIKDMKAEIKAIRDLVKEIEADLSLQTHRLQHLFLEDRRWPVCAWRERYIEHPLVAPAATALIWNLHRGESRTAFLWRDGHATDVTGTPIEVTAGADISLWHPVLCPAKEVLDWRNHLAVIGLQQPFKQAYREVYLVTDAEETTGTYSNRFAGHILRQHQMMSLARLNGWTVTHRFCADVPNDEPTHLIIPAYGLVAEYWTEGYGGDVPELADSQAYAYISTDQTRFYRLAAARGKCTALGPHKAAIVTMTDVPAIVFSEVMRHCDLFVCVSSIANDPHWMDAGRDAEHPSQWRREAADYATRQSLADLTATGESRRLLLELLLPRLAIKDRCRVDGRFLYVKGNLYSYKIHLGSGSILMEPNDQYLCIVPSSNAPVTEYGRLPFEGDRMFSVIMSKALLLAADDQITDTRIVNQLLRR